MREDQIEAEIKRIFQLVDHVYRTFGFEYSVELSTRPEKALGDDAIWDISESALKNVLDRLKVDYQLNEGDGAFYTRRSIFILKTPCSGATSAPQSSWIFKCLRNLI